MTTTSASPTLSARWPIITRAPSFVEPLGDRVRLEVAALHFVAEVHQHFGDAAHATAADADEVDAVDAAHAVAHAASSCSRQAAASSSAARGFATRRARSAMASSLPRPAHRSLSSAASRSAREIAIRDQHRRAFAHQVLRIEGLVVVDRRRKRHEHGAHAHGREFGDRQRAGTADHEVRFRVGARPCRR